MLLALGIFTYKNDQNIISLFENVNLLNLFQGDAQNLSSSDKVCTDCRWMGGF